MGLPSTLISPSRRVFLTDTSLAWERRTASLRFDGIQFFHWRSKENSSRYRARPCREGPLEIVVLLGGTSFRHRVVRWFAKEGGL